MRNFTRRRAEPMIMLINVVFLLLAFFLVAGTLAQRPPGDLQLVTLAEGAPQPLAGTVLLPADGVPVWPEGVVDAAGFVASLPQEAAGVARVLPDRDAPAQALVAIARSLQAAGAREIRMLAQREPR